MVVVGATCWVPAVGGGAPVPRSLTHKSNAVWQLLVQAACAISARLWRRRYRCEAWAIMLPLRLGVGTAIRVAFPFVIFKLCAAVGIGRSLEGRSSAADNPDCGNRMWLRGLLYEEI